jgi:periodic tryptophan protein 1
MASMITCTAWVPRGYAAPFPTKYNFDEEEFERIAAMAKLQLDDAREDLEEAEAEAEAEAEGEEAESGKSGSKKSKKDKKKSKDSKDDNDDDSASEFVVPLHLPPWAPYLPVAQH